MTDPINPYAPPRAIAPFAAGDLSALSAGELAHGWRLEADRLIARKGTVLPPICIWSGAPTSGMRVRRTLSWAPTWIAILALSPIVYLVVYLLVRKTGELDYALGEAARKRQRAAAIIGGGGAIVAGALGFAGAEFDLPLLIVMATGLFLVAFVAALVLARAIRPVKIDKEFIYLKLPPRVAEAFARTSAVEIVGS